MSEYDVGKWTKGFKKKKSDPYDVGALETREHRIENCPVEIPDEIDQMDRLGTVKEKKEYAEVLAWEALEKRIGTSDKLIAMVLESKHFPKTSINVNMNVEEMSREQLMEMMRGIKGGNINGKETK